MPKKGPLVIQAPFKQTELLKILAERTTLSKQEVASGLETFKEIMLAPLQKKGPQQFKWPGLLLMKIKNKPATKARLGINPFTGEETTFAAKPASRTVKISALKGLKEAI